MSGGDYLTREQAGQFFGKLVSEAREKSFILGAYDIGNDTCPAEMMPRVLDNQSTDMVSHGFEIERELVYNEATKRAYYLSILPVASREEMDADPMPKALSGTKARMKARVCWGDGESFDHENPERHGGVVTVTLSDSKGTLHEETVYLWQDREPEVRTTPRFLRKLYQGVHYVGSDD